MIQYLKIIVDFIRQYFPEYTVRFYNGAYNYFDKDTNTIFITSFLTDDNEIELALIIAQLVASRYKDSDLKNLFIDEDVKVLIELRDTKTPFNYDVYTACIMYGILRIGNGQIYAKDELKIPEFIINFLEENFYNNSYIFLNNVWNLYGKTDILEFYITTLNAMITYNVNSIFVYIMEWFKRKFDRKNPKCIEIIAKIDALSSSNSSSHSLYQHIIELYQYILSLIQDTSNPQKALMFGNSNEAGGEQNQNVIYYDSEKVQQAFDIYRGYLSKLKPLVDVIKENEKTRFITNQFSGKLNKRAIYKINQGNTRLFKRQLDTHKSNSKLYVSILIDISGSMLDEGHRRPEKSRITSAIASGLAFSSALEQVGKHSSVITFGSSVQLAKQWDSNFKIRDFLSKVQDEGDTLGEKALKYASNYMLSTTPDDASRIIIFLTDGSFSTSSELGTTRKQLAGGNVKVYGISLGDDYLTRIIKECQHVANPTQENVFKAFKNIFSGIANNGNKLAY